MSKLGGQQWMESRHVLSEHDRNTEQKIIADLLSQRSNFSGSIRESYDAMTALTPIVSGMVMERVEQEDVKGWWVSRTSARVDRAILFIHGGAYMLGSAEAYRGFASQLAERTASPVFVLDYPLAPEHPFPAAPDASRRALGWLVAQGVTHLALVGDSAGAALALGVLQDKLAQSTVEALVAFSPWTDLAFEGASFNDPETHDPIFQRPILTNAASAYLAGADPRNGLASPLYAIPDVLPPLAIQVGTEEFLLDDARRYADAAAARGGEVRLDIYEGLHHVFQRAIELDAARHALDAAASFILAHWRKA